MYSLQKLASLCTYQFAHESELVKAIDELSYLFTRREQSLDDYHQKEKLVAAYVHFYFPTNMAKWPRVWSLFSSSLQAKLSQCHLIEYGHGPGTYMHAWAHQFGAKRVLGGVEKSSLMQAQAKRLWQHYISSTSTPQFCSRASQLRVDSNTLLLFAHSANEMTSQQILKTIDQIKPHWILFLEPGTQKSFHQLVNMRESIQNQGYCIQYPCLSPSPCPMAQTQDDWCHQVLKVVHEADVARLCQLVKKDRNTMPSVVHLYAGEQLNKAKEHDSESVVFLRELNSLKYGVVWQVCRNDDQRNQLSIVELSKKDYSKVQWKRIKNLEPGRIVRTAFTTPLGDHRWRGRIGDF